MTHTKLCPKIAVFVIVSRAIHGIFPEKKMIQLTLAEFKTKNYIKQR
jgi:hypothetical protein